MFIKIWIKSIQDSFMMSTNYVNLSQINDISTMKNKWKRKVKINIKIYQQKKEDKKYLITTFLNIQNCENI